MLILLISTIIGAIIICAIAVNVANRNRKEYNEYLDKTKANEEFNNDIIEDMKCKR